MNRKRRTGGPGLLSVGNQVPSASLYATRRAQCTIPSLHRGPEYGLTAHMSSISVPLCRGADLNEADICSEAASGECPRRSATTR